LLIENIVAPIRVGDPISSTADLERVKMTVLPPHGDLDDVVELRERAVTGNEQSSPYLRLEVVQRDFQLDHGLRSRILRLVAHGITLKVKTPPLQIEGQE
jgi:hypothetical protein